MTKKEKHDFFIEFSNKALAWIEKNRKLVLTGLSTVLLLIIMVVIFVFYSKGQNIKLANLYYDATTKDLINKTDNIAKKDDKIYFDEKNIAKMKSGFENLLKVSDNSIYSYLSQYNMGIVYYSLKDYDKANEYFNKASEEKGFIFAGEALYNMANGFLNIGYNHYIKGEYDKALKSYKTAYISYNSVITKYANSYIFPLAMESKGLVKEYMAMSYLKLNQKDKAISVLNDAKKDYNKYLKDISKSFSDNLSKGYSAKIKTALRRVDIKLKKLK